METWTMPMRLLKILTTRIPFWRQTTVSAGTLDFFQEKVKSMDVHPYRTWPTLWPRSPHSICSGDVLKHGTEAFNKLFEV
jgi:hypothetical protein